MKFYFSQTITLASLLLCISCQDSVNSVPEPKINEFEGISNIEVIAIKKNPYERSINLIYSSYGKASYAVFDRRGVRIDYGEALLEGELLKEVSALNLNCQSDKVRVMYGKKDVDAVKLVVSHLKSIGCESFQLIET